MGFAFMTYDVEIAGGLQMRLSNIRFELRLLLATCSLLTCRASLLLDWFYGTAAQWARLECS
jgi:hypothetical protein